MGDWGYEKINNRFQKRTLGWQGNESEVMTERLDRRNIFLISRLAECREGDQVIFGKMFQPVVDENRPADDFRMREFLAGDQYLHHRTFIPESGWSCPAK
jgi:hypothetical protein